MELCECGHAYDLHHKGVAFGLEVFACEVCGCPEYSARHDPRYDPDDVAEFGYGDEGYPYSGLGKVGR